MKRKTFKSIFCVTIITVLFVICSCETTGNSQKETVPDPNFIADVPVFSFDTVALLSSNGNKTPQSNNFTYDFNARTNEVWVETKIAIDKFMFLLSPENRVELAEAMNTYLEMYEAGNLPEQKPSKKNAISKGKIKIYWGVLGYGYTGYGDYWTGYQYVEKGKPYFILDLGQAYDKESDAYSPLARVYFTPSQIKQQFEILNQDRLVEESLERENELYSFE